MKIKLITIGIVSLIGMSGCFNGSSNNGVSGEKAGILAYSSKDANDEPVAIDDAAMLRTDISNVFGDAYGEPIPVEDGDTVQDVLDRL